MFRLIGITFFVCFFLLISCGGKNKQSNQDLLTENVKEYFFLDDSIAVQVEVADTIHADEVAEMLSTIEKNLNLIDQDLDTLSLMIDDRAYKKLAYEQVIEKSILIGKNKYKDSLSRVENALLDLRLKQAVLNSKRDGFKQTNRVLLHFKRSIWANVAGYNVIIDYNVDDIPMHFELVTDANYTIVD